MPTVRLPAPARNPTQALLAQVSISQGLITDTPMEQVSVSFPKAVQSPDTLASRRRRHSRHSPGWGCFICNDILIVRTLSSLTHRRDARIAPVGLDLKLSPRPQPYGFGRGTSKGS